MTTSNNWFSQHKIWLVVIAIIIFGAITEQKKIQYWYMTTHGKYALILTHQEYLALDGCEFNGDALHQYANGDITFDEVIKRSKKNQRNSK